MIQDFPVEIPQFFPDFPVEIPRFFPDFPVEIPQLFPDFPVEIHELFPASPFNSCRQNCLQLLQEYFSINALPSFQVLHSNKEKPEYF